MKNNLLPVFIIFSTIIATRNSTKITCSWSDSDITTTDEKLDKILVIALMKDQTSLHKADDQMAAYLNGKGIVSYNYLDARFNQANKELLKSKIRSDGFDVAVIMGIFYVDKERIYTTGNTSNYPTYYQKFSGFYHRSRYNYSTPFYYTTTKTYSIEINGYSIKEDRIIWSELTKITNSEAVHKMT